MGNPGDRMVRVGDADQPYWGQLEHPFAGDPADAFGDGDGFGEDDGSGAHFEGDPRYRDELPWRMAGAVMGAVEAAIEVAAELPGAGGDLAVE